MCGKRLSEDSKNSIFEDDSRTAQKEANTTTD